MKGLDSTSIGRGLEGLHLTLLLEGLDPTLLLEGLDLTLVLEGDWKGWIRTSLLDGDWKDPDVVVDCSKRNVRGLLVSYDTFVVDCPD